MITIEPKKSSLFDLLLPLLGIAFVMFMCLHLAVTYDRIKLDEINGVSHNDRTRATDFAMDFMDRITNDPAEVQITKSTPAFLLGGTVFCLLAIGYFITSRKNLISRKEYGTAKWATAKDIASLFAENLMKKEIHRAITKVFFTPFRSFPKLKAKIASLKEKYKDADMLFTQTERICMHNYKLNNNTLIIGGSGSGKTRGFVMPNLLQAHSSYVITDPKGEILAKSGHFLETVMGYKIRVLNLDEKQMSSGYNPLKYVNINRPGWEERVLSLIETIIINTDGGEKKGGSDPFWDKAERLFLQAIIFAVVRGFPPEESNMNTVMMLIRWLKLEEEGDNFNSNLDKFFKCFADKYGEDHIAVDQFMEFREKASGKTAKSIVISAVARLAPFKVKEVKRIFSYDDMCLDRVGEEKTAVFVIVPPTDETYNFIAGMLFTQLFQELNHCALVVHKKDGQRLPVPCRFILDEFANTCQIPNFTKILAYARSLGIGIVTILQSLEQIKKLYKDDWGVVIDNSNTLLYLGKVTHMETLKYLSELLGKGTFDKQSSSRSKGKMGNFTLSSDRLGRELMDPSEIRKMKDENCLFFVGGKNPFFSVKYNYQKHKNYRYTSDADNDLTYSYTPLPPPDSALKTLKPKDHKSPHGEDVKSPAPQAPQKTADASVSQNKENDLFAILDAENQAEKSFADAVIKEAIEKSVVEYTTDPIRVAQQLCSFAKKEEVKPGSIVFSDNVVDDGEPPADQSYDEEPEYDDDYGIDDIMNDINMSGFAEMIGDMDTAMLKDTA